MKRKLFKGGKIYLFKNIQQSPLQIKSLRELTETPYTNKQRVLTEYHKQQFQEDLSRQIKILLEQQIDCMLKKINQIIQNNEISSKNVMNYVRSSILFKQNDDINSKSVNEILGAYTKNKIQDLKVVLQHKDKEIQRLNSEILQQKQFNQSNLQYHSINLNNFRQNQISLQSQNNTLESSMLFQKAKNSTKKQFDEYFKKMKLKFIPSISRLRPYSLNHMSNKNKKKLIYKNNKQQYLQRLIQIIRQKDTINDSEKSNLLQFINKDLTRQCLKPCCKWSEQNFTPSKPATPFQVSSNRSKSYYKSDKIDEYYNHYYHTEVFQVDKITSLIKTNSEQMEKLYKKYKSKQKHLIKKSAERRQSIL